MRDRARVYASAGLFSTPGPLIEDVKRARDFGFDGYKLRVVSTKTIIAKLRPSAIPSARTWIS